MPELNLKQHGITYSACGRSSKNKERIQKFKETRGSGYAYRNKLGKVCLQHDMDYGDFKDLAKITTSHKVLCDKAFNAA